MHFKFCMKVLNTIFPLLKENSQHFYFWISSVIKSSKSKLCLFWQKALNFFLSTTSLWVPKIAIWNDWFMWVFLQRDHRQDISQHYDYFMEENDEPLGRGAAPNKYRSVSCSRLIIILHSYDFRLTVKHHLDQKWLNQRTLCNQIQNQCSVLG